jgi:hypothetical protein
MERTDLLVGERANRLRAVRVSRHRPSRESRRVSDNRMLWKGNALMRFAHFSSTNSIRSNAAELRLQSRHVAGVPMENRPPMTRRDWASEIPHRTMDEIILRVVRLARQRPEGMQSQISKTVLQLNSNDSV